MIADQFIHAFGWVSWGSIIAGTITALAITIVMGLLGVALGFTVVDPKSDEPAAGLGKAFGLWTVISVIVSMGAGGFIAGLFAGRNGMEHGFMVWALGLLVLVCFSSHAVASMVRGIGHAVRGAGSGAVEMASSVGHGIGHGVANVASNASHAVSHAVSQVSDKVNLHLDTDKLNDQVMGVLRDTGVDTLQPDYIKQQMREARADLRRLVRQLTHNPSDASQFIADFMDKQRIRLQNMTATVDKNTAVTALMKNRGIAKADAEELVENATCAYYQAVDKAKDALAEANDQIDDIKENMRDMAEQARVKADKMAGSAAKAALGGALALVIAALITMGAGAWGEHHADDTRYKVVTPMHRIYR